MAPRRENPMPNRRSDGKKMEISFSGCVFHHENQFDAAERESFECRARSMALKSVLESIDFLSPSAKKLDKNLNVLKMMIRRMGEF